jgi:hypothetical protein
MRDVTKYRVPKITGEILSNVAPRKITFKLGVDDKGMTK